VIRVDVDRWSQPFRALFRRSAPTPAELRAALDRHVFAAWFPRCLDEEHGGFLCDFDTRWRPGGEQVKLLEFQARQTRVAALGCRLHGGGGEWFEATRHGLAVLRDVMWDRERGGFFALCRRDGEPLDGGDKHGHGTAYAIQALVEVAHALDDVAALELARQAFEWFDVSAWDEGHGGYWGWLRADGRPYALTPDSAPRVVDHVGTPLGCKDTNVNGDALEALTAMSKHFDVPRARRRVEQLHGLFDRLIADCGCLPEKLDRRFARVGDAANAGNALQASYRLPLARRLLGEPLRCEATEQTLRDFADGERGATGGIRSPLGDEQWWTQFELLRSAAFTARHGGESSIGATRQLAAGWSYLQREFLDDERGGCFFHPRSSAAYLVKGDRWKDGSHDAFALASAAGLLDD